MSKLWKAIFAGVGIALAPVGISLVGGIFNVSAAMLDITLINVDLDWIGMFDGFCANKYNDKYNIALERLEKSLYSESYDTLVVCKNGLNYDVIYTIDDINEKCNECKTKYTSDTIESLYNFLETGNPDEIENINLHIDYDIVQEDKTDEISRIKKLVTYAKEFISTSNNGEYIEALELYSKHKLDGYLTDYLSKVVKNSEDNVLNAIDNYLEEGNLSIAEDVYQLIRKYSKNEKLIKEIDVDISGYKVYKSVNENYEQNKYINVIKIVNKQPKLKEYDKIKDIYSNSVYRYTNDIRDKVDELAKNADYDKLNAVLDEAMKYVDSDSLKDLKKKYGLYNDREIWYCPYINGSRIEKKDQLYMNNLLFKNVYSFYSNNYLAIENKFKTISGLLFIDQNSSNYLNNSDCSIDINIYGDRDLLKRITLNKETSEVKFQCDNLSKYSTIKVEVVNANHISYAYLTNFYGEK